MSDEYEKRIADIEKDIAVIKIELESVKEFQKELKKDRRTFFMWFLGLIGSGMLTFLAMVAKKTGIWQ